MSVCVYTVFVLSCVEVAALRRTDPPSKKSYTLCIKIKKMKRGLDPTTKVLDGWVDGRTDGRTDRQTDR
jgi:hypothetical protein